VQLQPARDSAPPFAHVAARASVSGDLESIALFIQGLEAGPQLLAVRELSITQPETAVPPNRRETLRVELTVEGLYERAGGVRP
jgi:hypothetical protein